MLGLWTFWRARALLPGCRYYFLICHILGSNHRTTAIVRGHLAAWTTLGVVFGFAISSARQADGGYTDCAEAQCDPRPAVDRCRWTIAGSRRSMGYAGCG